MRILNSEWNKRLVAGLLAIAMLSSIMPPVVMAEDTTEQNDDTELLLEVDALDTDATMKTTGETTEATGETTEATEETTEATEETMEATTGATTSDNDVVEVESLLSMPMMLLSEGETVTDGETQPETVDTQAKTEPSLSLTDAGLTPDGEGIVVNTVEQLILLSNVFPTEYQNQTITLSLTKDYDWSIGKNVTYNNATYVFLGLGDGRSPFNGNLVVSNSTQEASGSIRTIRPFFNNLDTNATITGTLRLGTPDSETTISVPLLANTVSGRALETPREWNVELIEGGGFGGLIGTLESGSVRLKLSGTNTSTLTCSAEGHTGLFCNTMAANTSLTVENSAANVSVKANGMTTDDEDNVVVAHDAGGFVGRMASGASLKASGAFVAGVGSEEGNAGGIVGTMESNATVNAAITSGAPIITSNGNAGGVVGTMAENTHVQATVTSGTSTITSTNGHAGGFAGKMEAGSSLEATGSLTASVTAGKVPAEGETSESEPIEQNAGGIVGTMAAGVRLTATIDSSDSVGSITSYTGHAGGIAGCAEDANLTLSGTGNATITVHADKNAGGVLGYYVNSKSTDTLDLLNYQTTVTISGGSNAGGVFGALTNNTGTDSAASAYTIQNGSVTVTATGSVTNFGGLIGYYSASAMVNTLKTSDMTVTSTNSGSAASYGGIIGSVGDNSYVEFESAGTVTTAGGATTNFGGLVGVLGAPSSVGAFLNIGNVKLVRESNPSAGTAVGGLVGALTAGVVRLHGTTDLSGMTFTGAGGGTGQIVGKNTNGLVYAVGTGNTGDAGWLLKRPTGRTASDIGNWGQVVRLDGERLTEKNDNNTASNTDLFAFNETNHTVTVLGGGSTITSARDFASYALHYDFGSTDQAALKFSAPDTERVEPNRNQNVTITEDIDLTGTGILGIGRDDGAGNPDGVFFQGTISGEVGKCPTITLDIGCSAFGDGIDKIADPIGNGGLQLFSDGHNYLGLLSVAGGSTTISNLTIAGAVMGNSGRSAKGRVAGAVGYCRADINFDSVTVSANVTVKGSGTIYQGGFFGDLVNGNKTATFQNCTWSGTLDNSVAGSKIGGFAAYIQNGQKTITVDDCTLSGTITTSAGGDAHVGGLFADIDYANDSTAVSNVSISNLSVSGTITAASAATTSCGGFLGYSWLNTNVSFDNPGVTISGATLNTGSAKFGGLVYQATGYWNATAANSIKFTSRNVENSTETIKTQIFGDTSAENPSGLLVGTGIYSYTARNVTHYNNLYLEVGTFGSAGAAYYYDNTGVTLTLSGNATSFDELVGKTIVNNFGHDNAVVSLATASGEIDNNNECTTYTRQTGTNYQNPKTRYYYNLNRFRESVDVGNLTSAGDVLCWSVSQYAAENIRDYFCRNSGGDATISGETIDLTHYSYYPITAFDSVTVNCTGLKFGYETIETSERANKKPSEQNQHYLMHYGLLYELGGSLSVSGTTLSGTVGKLSRQSGALILNTISGNAKQNPVARRTISLQNVELAGLRVSGVTGGNTVYPLLINNIGEAVTLTVDGLSTGEGYVETGTTNTLTAATSLIGNVGSETATELKLVFSNIALDARKSAGTSTSVSNNGASPVAYHTYKSIFTRATLLESFKYTTSSSGYYNFNHDADRVTYGVEISNTTSGRNQTDQYEYFDNSDKTWDGLAPKVEDGGYYNFTSGYLRYVHQPESGNTHELDINRKPHNLENGCGTYGDPYIIENGKQLVALAKYLQGNGEEGFKVTLDTRVLDAQAGNDVNYYHTKDNGEDNHVTYTWTNSSNGSWSDSNERSGDKTKIDNYLRNAYYWIENDINITETDWAGLGTSTDPFSGVIVGANKTITLQVSNQNVANFGGLIKYSRGSVVKNLTVAYPGGEDGANIQITNTAVPGSGTNNPFFGGVVGYCMGGDTIIDGVSVTNGGTINLSGRLIAAGGYVGLVGGAKDSSGYEKTGGGVVFRGTIGNSNFGKDDSTFFYKNPYVGRVLDGYACYEGGNPGSSTLNNTDKNYTIPDVTGESGLSVDYNQKTVTVSSAQGLWLLSAIVNSGAGAMDSDGNYKDYVKDKYVEAYQYGKPRTCDYNLIGMDGGSADIGDEAYWGKTGNKTGNPGRVSYLVNKYANSAQYLTGGAYENHNSSYTLIFDADTIDMSGYKNGFRGIGASFGQKVKDQNAMWYVYRRSLRVNKVSGADGGTTITLAMEQHDYQAEYDGKCWSNQGAGLFTVLYYETLSASDPALVENLTITGNVSALTYDASGNQQGTKKVEYDVGVGGFASRTGNSSGQKLKFNNFHLSVLNVTGGTATGGVIGLNACAGDIEFTNWTISTVKVDKWVTNDGSTGGFVGWHNSKKPIKIVGYGSPEGESDRSYNVQDLTVTITAETKQYGNVGGFSGANDNGSALVITDVNVQDMKVTGEAARNVGGLADGGKSDITIDNCWLENITVTGQKNAEKNAASGQVGGLIGFSDGGTKSVTNVTITGNSTIKSDAGGAVGGMIGTITGGTCYVGDVTLEQDVTVSGNNAAISVGGIIGETGGTSKIGIKKVNGKEADAPIKLTGATIQGKSCTAVGGVVGQINSSTTVQNITICDLSAHSAGTNEFYVGGVVGVINNEATITDVQITGESKIYSECDMAAKVSAHGTHVTVGGLAGYAKNSNDITVERFYIKGTPETPVRVLHPTTANNKWYNCASGMIGWTSDNCTITITDSKLEYVYVLSGEMAGGVVGFQNNKQLNVRNVTISNCVVAIPKQTGSSIRKSNYAGLLIGNEKNNVAGYNILLDQSTVGYFQGMPVDDVNGPPSKSADALLLLMNPNDMNDTTIGLHDGNSAATFYPYSAINGSITEQQVGRWIGRFEHGGNPKTCTLVAVAVNGENIPHRDLGQSSDGFDNITNITYADYPVAQTNPDGSASPWLDVNPEGVLTLGSTTCTGNGVSLTDGTSIPRAILNAAKSPTFAQRYCNVKDSDSFKFSDFLTENNTARLRTFYKYFEQEENGSIPEGITEDNGKFPLLVVNNTNSDAVNAAIWNYIAALTNVSSGEKAKTQASGVQTSTYQWKDGAFTNVGTPTITASGTSIICRSGAFDNGKSQFTLLDVTYADPTGGNANGFHLYVPVLVKKIMDAKVDVKILTGTNYYRGDYAGAQSHATAGFDEQFTAYITYNYNRSKDEWQSALDDGSPLLWYYEKTLDLIGKDQVPGLLPAGTKMTLVNAQSGQMYYHELAAVEENEDTQAAYKLESHFVNSSGQPFASSPVCDLLGITAAEVTEESKNRYVVEQDPNYATVRIGSTYYRPYNPETDGGTAENDIFSLTVGDVVDQNKYLTTPEGYYLTIQVPQKEGTDSINNPLTIWSNNGLGKTENALPVRVSGPSPNTSMRYVIYDGIQSSDLTEVATTLKREGTEVETTVVQNDDTIEVTLSSEIRLSDNGNVKTLFRNMPPAELYHQFSLSLRKSDAAGNLTDWILGAQSIQWEYFVDGESKASDSLNPEGDMEVLTITLGKDKTGLIDKFKEHDKVTVKAVITLSYGNNVGAIFPERASNDHSTGLLVHAKSCVAMDYNQLAIATVKSEADHSARYYCESPSHATMSYNAIEKYGTDGKTLQLGINPLDRYSIGICAEGTYDYSAVSETTLENATKIRYTLELFRKGEDGKYPNEPVNGISSYLPAPTLVTNQSGGSETFSDSSGNSYQLEREFKRADSGNEIIIMDLEPKTGSDLEAIPGFYANYRVRLTAVMLDAEGNPLSDTQASDYIVYTNAKILQNLVSDHQ